MECISNNIVNLFDQQALATPEQTAIIEYKLGRARAITYKVMRKKVLDQAKLLKRRGVSKGDMILIMHPLSSELYINLLAVLRVGAICLFAEPNLSKSVFFKMIKMFRPKMVLSRFIPEIYFKSYKGSIDIAPVKLKDTALLSFKSSGNTQPEIIKRTHGHLHDQISVLKNTLNVEAGEREITNLPIFTLVNLVAGVTTILPNGDLSQPEKMNIKSLLKTIIEQRATRLLFSPAIIENLLLFNKKNPITLADVKQVNTTCGAISLRELKDLPTLFPNAQIRVIYTTSQAEPISVLDLDQVSLIDLNKSEHGAGVLVGAQLSGITLSVDPIDNPIATNNMGEIIVSAKHISGGYKRTGDIGYIDEHGRIWLVGRKSKTICDTTTSLSLETACAYIEGVSRAACFKIGERSYLYVKLMPGVKEIPDSVYAFAQMHNIDELRIRSDIPLDKKHQTKDMYKALTPSDWRRTG